MDHFLCSNFSVSITHTAKRKRLMQCTEKMLVNALSLTIHLMTMVFWSFNPFIDKAAVLHSLRCAMWSRNIYHIPTSYNNNWIVFCFCLMNFDTSEKAIVKYKIHNTHAAYTNKEKESSFDIDIMFCIQNFMHQYFFYCDENNDHTHVIRYSFTNVINAINNNNKSIYNIHIYIYRIFHSCSGYNQLNRCQISMAFIYLKFISRIIQPIWSWSNQQ